MFLLIIYDLTINISKLQQRIPKLPSRVIGRKKFRKGAERPKGGRVLTSIKSIGTAQGAKIHSRSQISPWYDYEINSEMAGQGH